MTLYDGPLGKVFGGRWPGLEFSPSAPAPAQTVASKVVQSLTLKAVTHQVIDLGQEVYKLLQRMVMDRMDTDKDDGGQISHNNNTKKKAVFTLSTEKDSYRVAPDVVPENVAENLTKRLI